LRDGRPDQGNDVADVLDFFETVAVLINRGVLDPYLAWHTFYWSMVNFYVASRDYIEQRRQLEGTNQWQDIERAIPALIKLEGTREFPNNEQTRRFLAEISEGYEPPRFERAP
jgi:hypothetical protein